MLGGGEKVFVGGRGLVLVLGVDSGRVGGHMEAVGLLFLGAIRRLTCVALLSAATTTAPLCRGVNDDGLRHLLNNILRSLRMRRFFSSLKSCVDLCSFAPFHC